MGVGSLGILSMTFLQLVFVILGLAFALAGLPIDHKNPLIEVQPPELWKTQSFIGLSILTVTTSLIYFVASIKWTSLSMWTKSLINIANFTAGILLGICACVLIAEYAEWTNQAFMYCDILENICISELKSMTFLNYDLAMTSGPLGLVASFLSVGIMSFAIYKKEIYTRGDADQSFRNEL